MQTPSPRRFLLNKKPHTSTTPTPSKLSQQVLQDAPDTSTARPTSGPAPSQFARVPRFALSTARRASIPPRSPSPGRLQSPISSVVVRKQHQMAQSIYISDDEEEMLDNDNLDFTPTQAPSEESVPEPEPEKALPFTPHLPPSTKRRRIDDGEASSTPQPTPGRFILPSTDTSQTTFGHTDGATPSRPAFLMASLPPPEPAEPLPDAFSPRRRGQKFMPGGLAAELQSWVIEAAQTASHSKHGKGMATAEDWMQVMKIEEAEGDGPIFARGTVTGRGHAQAVLVDGQAKQKNDKVKAGETVSIRLPTWDVQVLGETWMVGVDWRTTKS